MKVKVEVRNRAVVSVAVVVAVAVPRVVEETVAAHVTVIVEISGK